jgi:hypothetical protein
MPVITHTRRRSDGSLETTYLHTEDGFTPPEWSHEDSVQQTCDGKLRIGDMCRPTKAYLHAVQTGLTPEQADVWHTGTKLVEIGPEGFPWGGCHSVELAPPFDTLFLDSSSIEKLG